MEETRYYCPFCGDELFQYEDVDGNIGLMYVVECAVCDLAEASYVSYKEALIEYVKAY